MTLASLLPQLVSASIVLVVFGLGLQSSRRDALSLFRAPRLLSRSLLSLIVVMPLVAAGLVVAFDCPWPVKVALLALAVSPVPPLLPKKQSKAGGDASYAIGLLVAAALLAIVTVPISVSWIADAFHRSGGIGPLKVAKVVLTSVLLPLAAGIAVRELAPGLAARIARPVAMLGTLMLVASALPLAYAVWPVIHSLIGDGTVLVVAAMATTGLVVGHVLGGPAADTRTDLALSTTSRHPAVALAVAVGAGAESKAGLAAVLLYVIVATLVCIPYVAWRRSLTTEPPMSSIKGSPR